MDKQFKAILRTGAKLDMFREIEELQETYYNDMQASVDSYETYDEVANETYADYRCVCKTLETFARLGYLFPEEVEAMKEAVYEQRLEVLKVLKRIGESKT